MRLVADKGDDHAVEVEEEHDKVEAELDERFLMPSSAACKCGRKNRARAYLLVDVELSENLGRVQEVLVLEDPVSCQHTCLQEQSVCNRLLCVPCKQRQVEDQSDPVAVDKEQNGDESVDGSFGDDVGVEAVAKVNRVDVITEKRNGQHRVQQGDEHRTWAYHSRSLYMMVKKTWRKRLTALISTAIR